MPRDYSTKAGCTKEAVKYSFIGAMHPKKKESAYLYLPTYIAGLIYHLGTFFSLFLFILIFIDVSLFGILKIIISCLLVISGSCGFGILIKRIFNKNLLSISNPDDFISNLIVTFFHFITALIIYTGNFLPVYYVSISLLLLYIPISKLKHTIFFFAARYHLGYFFGWRNVWPPEKI